MSAYKTLKFSLETTKRILSQPVFPRESFQFYFRNLSKTSATSDKYLDDYKSSIENPEEYWAEHAEKISWFRKWDSVLDVSNPPFCKWFVLVQ